jgi:hypothetical protein
MHNFNVRTWSLFLGLIIFSGLQLQAQTDKSQPTPSVNLEGPRIGMTYITEGEMSRRLESEFSVNPFITQFGWQFEKQYFNLSSGVAGLIEGVVLVGGLEQNVFLPSLSMLVGIRNAKGFEFGFGPNLSLAGAGMVFAVGSSIQSGGLIFPVNLAVIPSSSGTRISLLVGFNVVK